MSDNGLLDQIIDNNPYGFLLTDGEGRPVRWNAACLKLFGAHETPPPNYSVLTDPVLLRAGFGEALARVQQGETIPPIELWYDPHDVDPTIPSKPLCLKSTLFPLCDEQGQVKNLVIMHEDISARKQAESLYERREAILQAIASAAQMFLKSPDWRLSMPAVLAEIGQAAAATAAYLFQRTRNGRVELACYWSEEGGEPIDAQGPQAHPVDHRPFGRWNRILSGGGVVKGTPAEFPRPERQALERRRIQSVLQIPVFADGAFWGFIGFDDGRGPRQWSEGEVAALTTMAGLLGSTIARNRLELDLQEAKSRLEEHVAERTTELVSANQALQSGMAERQMLARAVENAGEGIGVIDAAWKITYANPELARILGRRRPAGVLGSQWEHLFEPDQPRRRAEIEEALRSKKRWAGTLTARGRRGRPVPVAVTLVRMSQSEGEELVVANVRDQSAEEAYLAQIRKLTLDAARSLEEERARLSRELHDEVGQTLTAINLNLAWLASRSQAWDAPARERLDEAKQFVNQMLESIRMLSTSLRPPILDNRGLLEAIRSYAGEFSRRAGIACRVVASPSDLEVPDPIATTLFRILQEAVTNVARHARADRCGIFLKLSGQNLELKVRDNGVGAVPKRLEGVQSLGIAGMRERAASVGGALTIENRPDGGLCVTVRLPWQQV